MKINDDSPGKFDQVDEGIFLGYSTKSKAYKCYNIWLWKIVESINVNIIEVVLEKEFEINEDDHILRDLKEYAAKEKKEPEK